MESKPTQILVEFYEHDVVVLLLIGVLVQDGHHAADEYGPDVIGLKRLPEVGGLRPSQFKKS